MIIEQSIRNIILYGLIPDACTACEFAKYLNKQTQTVNFVNVQFKLKQLTIICLLFNE